MAEPTHLTWREIIDGWVRDPTIRRHALLALGMALGATVLAVGLATGALVAAADAMLPSAVAKLVAGGALSTGTGGWLLRRRRRRVEVTRAQQACQRGVDLPGQQKALPAESPTGPLTR